MGVVDLLAPGVEDEPERAVVERVSGLVGLVDSF